MFLNIKKATKKNSNFILSCRNQIDARKYSQNKKIIKKKDHNDWYSSLIKKKQNEIFILRKNNINIGYIRIEKINNLGKISIVIKKKFQGKGLGKKGLLIAEKKSKFKEFIANVDKKNKLSIKLFLSAGYKKINEKEKLLSFMKKKKKININNKLINSIEKIRGKNNNNWMDILRLAFKHDPKETSKILKNIYQKDTQISKIVKKLI